LYNCSDDSRFTVAREHMHIYVVKMIAVTYKNTLKWIHHFTDIFCHINLLLQVVKSKSGGSYAIFITGTIKQTDFMLMYRLPMFYVPTLRYSHKCYLDLFQAERQGRG
jgi:hypothetical protein